MSKDKKREVLLRPAKDLSITFPDRGDLEAEEADKIQKAVTKGGVVYPKKGLFENRTSLKTILQTDTPGAKRAYINAPEEDKFSDGNNDYISVAEIKKQIEKRKEQPRNALEQEQLSYADKCLDAFREAKELKKERELEALRIQRDRPKMTAMKMSANGDDRCQLSGKTLNGKGQGHHIERVADAPEKARDLDNIIIVSEEIHRDIHSGGYDTVEGLKEYIKKNGYETPPELNKK